MYDPGRRGFWIHLFIYIVVIAGLATLNLVRNPSHPWFLWVLVGWGLGVILHAALVYRRRY